MKPNSNKETFNISQKTESHPKIGTDLGIGDNHPPKNSRAVRADTNTILAYSANMNSAKVVPEYSTWNPATISDSPSATSNGARFVSTTPEIK